LNLGLSMGIQNTLGNKRPQGHKFHAIRVSGAFAVTMFLGGSYHDRDNPHMWGVSHGQLITFITLVCSQKEGRQQSSSRKGDRTSVADDEMRMMMMMMMILIIFYGGTVEAKPHAPRWIQRGLQSRWVTVTEY
jgi:hypothetical protein